VTDAAETVFQGRPGEGAAVTSADTIREALTEASVLHDDLGYQVIASDCHQALAALDRLVAERDRLREFYEAHWAVEQGIADFDLHDEAVTRLHAARDALAPKGDG